MNKPLHVLLVEDSPDDADLLEAELVRGGFQPRLCRVETRDEMKAALRDDGWDVVLTDYQLPLFSAAEALTTLQESGRDLPIIILSGVVEAEEAVKLLKLGAHDFLNKDALARLVPAIERELREATERAKRRVAEERVRMLSFAVEQSPAGVAITDSTGEVVYANPRFVALTECEVDQVIGHKVALNPASGHKDITFDRLLDTTLAEREWRGEFSMQRHNGEKMWELITVSPLKSDCGSVTNFVVVREDISERKQFEEQLVRKANFDELTGLPNRALVRDRLDQAIAAAQRHHKGAALLYIDLDRFKNINDTLGHDAGDVLIREVGNRLLQNVREGDTLARMGGDEFVVILTEVEGGESVQSIAERMIESFKQPFNIAQQSLFVSPSIGITLFPDDGTDHEALLRNADVAMYKAKEQGGNSFHFFTLESNQRMRERLAMENRMRGAAARGEMIVQFQPLMDLRTRNPVAVEALVRWRRDDGSLCMPSQFIPVAESVGLIGEIGGWVLDAALSTLLRFDRFPELRVAVNVSPRQLQASDFGDTVASLLAEHGLASHRLELEITESVLLDDSEQTANNLKKLLDLGVRLSIDDFGTGYSALGYLQKYPFDTLKIDRSFIWDVLHNPSTARLVETIVAMAHGMELEVVAEGVETTDQLSFLHARGCDIVQGYLFSKPVSVEELKEKMDRGETLLPSVI